MTKARLCTLISLSALVGSLVWSGTDGSTRQHPDPTIPPLDPTRVECTAFRPASAALCYQTANDLYQLFELILSQIAANEVEQAIQETLPTTPQLFPDGTVVYGVEGFASIAAAWAGADAFTFLSVTNTFRYRPLDRHTVVAYGGVEFTIRDTNQGVERTIASVQTELFRRNPRMPRGWEQVAEQLAYVTPLLGEQ